MSTGSVFQYKTLRSKYVPPMGDAWQDQAVCKGADSKLFDFNEDDPQGSSLLNSEAIDSYCQFCPVIDDCLKQSSAEDLIWSVRGGLMPKGHDGGEEVEGSKRGDGGRFVTIEIEKRLEEYVCKREHPRERARITFRKNGKLVIICLDCKKVYESKRSGARLAAYNKKRRDERAALRAAREEKS